MESATLLRELNQRTYGPEDSPAGATEPRRVVDLYGASTSAVPTNNGLRIDINLDDVLSEHRPVAVQIDGYDAGTFS